MTLDAPTRMDDERVWGISVSSVTCFQVGKARARVSEAMQKKRMVRRMVSRGGLGLLVEVDWELEDVDRNGGIETLLSVL